MGTRDSFDISAEISGISMMITGLANQTEEGCDSLRPDALRTALFGISSYLDRIADDIGDM